MPHMKILTAGLVVAAALAGTPATASAAAPGSPIKHVIEVMIENHTFDNLFGSFRGADGIPPGTSLPNPGAYYHSAPDVPPVYARPNEGDVMKVLNNSRLTQHTAMHSAPGTNSLMSHSTVFPPHTVAPST